MKLPYELDRFVTKYGIKIDTDIPNTMSADGLVFMGMIAKTLPEGAVIAEAGALYGASSYALAANAPQATVYSIDPWQHEDWMDKWVRIQYPFPPKLSVHAFRSYTHELENIVPVQGFAPDALEFDGEIDMFFEDATHTEPVFSMNMDRFMAQLKPGGVLCGDDFGNAFPEVRDGVLREYNKWERPSSGVRGLVWAFAKPGGTALHDRLADTFEEIFASRLEFASGETADTTGFAFAIKVQSDIVTRITHPDTFELELLLDGKAVARSQNGVLDIPPGTMLDEVAAHSNPGMPPVVLDFVVWKGDEAEWSRRSSPMGGTVNAPGELSNLKASYRVV